MAGTPAIGWVRVTSADPPLQVTVRLSDERPTIDSGYGGWDEIARPRRSPITTYKGSPGLHLTLPLLLDGWAQGRSVEREIAVLERMGQRTASDGEPPRLRVIARGAAIPHQERRWVINEIAWGDALMNRDGNRVRQQVTLSLIEYVEDVHLAERSAAKRRRAKATSAKQTRGATKRITVRRSNVVSRVKLSSIASGVVAAGFGEGEDLLSIAARELGDASRWVEIAKLNNLRDPRAIAPGQVLRLP